MIIDQAISESLIVPRLVMAPPCATVHDLRAFDVSQPTKPEGQMSKKRAARLDTLTIVAKTGETAEQAMSRHSIRPEVRAASTILQYAQNPFREVPITELVAQLSASADAINNNKMEQPERMLMNHAQALDSIFHEMARRAALNMNEHLAAMDTYMRLALKAQSQCRVTLETLAEIKNPPVVFAKQANISNGPQQINNGVAQAAKTEITQSKLLEHANGERLDTRATGTASRADQALETLGTINGAEVH